MCVRGFCNMCVCVGFVICACVCGFCNMCVCVCVGFVICVCVRGFCNVWVCLCMGFVTSGSFDNCVGVLVICVLVFTVFLY